MRIASLFLISLLQCSSSQAALMSQCARLFQPPVATALISVGLLSACADRDQVSLTAPIETRVCTDQLESVEVDLGRYMKSTLESEPDSGLFTVRVFTTSGDFADLELLRKGVCNVGLISRPTYAHYRRANQTTNEFRLRSVARVLDRLTYLVCSRELQIANIRELAERTQKGEDIPIYVGKQGSDSLALIQTLKDTRPDYKNLRAVPNPTDQVSENFARAVSNRGCAAWVAPLAPPAVEDALEPFATKLNLVDFADRNYLIQGGGEPYFEYKKLPEETAEVLRQMKPSVDEMPAELWTLNLGTELVTLSEYAPELFKTIDVPPGDYKFQQKWSSVRRNLESYPRDIQLVAPTLQQIPTEPVLTGD